MVQYYYVYILKCSDNSYYVGFTEDLHSRLWEHNEGIYEDSYTYFKRPVFLLYAEEYENLEDALKREKQLKGWNRAKKEALITGNEKDLPDLSKCRNITHFENFKY